MTTLAVFTKNRTNPAYEAARIGADRMAAAFGVQVMHFVPDAPDDTDQQLSLLKQARAMRPDALVFTPVHASRLDEPLRAVVADGIPVFGFVNRMDEVPCISQVGSDDGDLAERIAMRLFDAMGGQGRVAVVDGIPGAVTSEERGRGFDRALARHPQIRLEARCTGRYHRGIARDAFSQVLREHPHIDGVLAANDVMALGVLDALDEAKRRATVVGVNAIPEAVQAIAHGRLHATADFNAMAMCALATECAIRYLRKQPVPRHIVLPVEIVDRHNWRGWAMAYADRSLPTLAEIHQP